MESWFVNSAFVAGGAALVASPVIIHLLNRMRYRRVRFAAMEFLLQSEQRNRRRILFEQLLLLMLRVLIVLAIVALIARLILDPQQLAMFRGAQTHHLVLLDDSGSMRDRLGETTAFDEGLKVVRKIAAEGSRRPGTQQLSLLLLSGPDQPLFSQRDLDREFINELDVMLENVRCSHRGLDLVDGLDAAGKLLAAEKGVVKHLHVVSDFRKADWQNQKAISGAVESLDAAGVTVNLVRTVGSRNANLAVIRLSGDLHVAAARIPVRLNVAVKNFDQQVASDVRLIVQQDGEKLPMSIKFDKIEPGEEVERDFFVTFDSPKKHRIEVGLEADALAHDNTRYLAMDISAVNRVLIVDGDPSGEEGLYLVDALSPESGTTEYVPQIESVDFLRRRPLDEFQSIYLLNVPELPVDAIEPLENYVRSGGGLAWFLGDSIKPGFYNDKLYKEGNGLFPARLAKAPAQLPHDDSTTPGPDLQFADHPVFRVFQGQENPYIDATRIFNYFPVADDWAIDDQQRRDATSTIATLRNRQPIAFQHKLGKGTVVTFLTTCGPAWNNAYAFGSYVVLMLELQRHIARTDRMLERRIVGEPIVESFDPAEFTETVEISAPDAAGTRQTRLQAVPQAVHSDRIHPDNDGTNPVTKADKEGPPLATRLTASYRETDTPGIYTVRLIDQNQVPVERWIAYNVPTHESDLEIATSELIRRQIGEDVRVTIQEPGTLQWIEGKDIGQEVREWLLALLVLALVVEQLLAYKLSYHPTRRSAAQPARAMAST